MSFTDVQDSLLPEEDYELSMEESHYHHCVQEFSELVDNHSLYNCLIDVSRYTNNPEESHLANQLVKLLENYERVLLSMHPADVILQPADRFKHVSEVTGKERQQWWQQ